jgi:glycosyltransferase involved in cell wall biosynthesis
MRDGYDLRVCVVCPDLAPDYDLFAGNARVAHELLQNFHHEGIEILAISNARGDKRRLSAKGYELLTFPGDGHSPLFLVHALRALRRLKPDIIHAHGSLRMAQLLSIVKKFTSARCVMTLTKMPSSDILLKSSIRSADEIICLTNYVAGELERKGVRNVHVVPYGLEPTFLQTISRDNNLVSRRGEIARLCFWGDATKRRGFETVLDCYESMPDDYRGIRLFLAVRKMEDTFVDRVIALQEMRNLTILTPKRLANFPRATINLEPIAQVVGAADIVLLPFLENPLEPPLTLVESMALGRPVITTSVNSNSELIGSNERGILVEKARPDLFKEAVISCLKGDIDLENLGRRARDFISDYFNSEKNLTRIYSIYEGLSRN